ncbi:MAG: RdgB/HAM1 family non-canonical purine NTP pyrophosphatase [Ferruginibacter sp.]
MTPIIFATNNNNKILEVQSLIKNDSLIIKTLEEEGIDIDIAEPFLTLEDNAKQKASVINKLSQKNCFAEDTGLFVRALSGAPGVKSARYAGEERSDKKNIKLLLHNLSEEKNRSAYFKTVICLIWDKETYFFEGICEGTIISEKKGEFGFGYDPVFIPKGSQRTFAEMAIAEKNIFSHRKKALVQLIDFFAKQNKS